jgi:ATP adenylyltransferase
MVAPYRHVESLVMMEDDEIIEMMMMTKKWERRIRQAYNPQGLNIGANIGETAGAGVIGHFHMHMVPRWSGDTSHMTVFSNTKVMPQALDETYRILISAKQE